jgi:hypothetical protein
MIGMASPVQNVEKKQTDYHRQQSESQKDQGAQERFFIVKVHEIKEDEARFERGQDQHRPNRQRFMPNLARQHKESRENEKNDPDPDEGPVRDNMTVRFCVFHRTFQFDFKSPVSEFSSKLQIGAGTLKSAIPQAAR